MVEDIGNMEVMRIERKGIDEKRNWEIEEEGKRKGERKGRREEEIRYRRWYEDDGWRDRIEGFK